MDIPEQDKQALMDAFRKRSQPKQGGAAFGVYPSSGKRPEKLNVSRDVNMPAQAARGWVAGTLGLPGDIESLGRMAVNFAFGPGGVNVDETPVLPTSEFYQEYLPGRDERPAAKFASGLGALAGGAGSTKVAGAAVRGAKATGKALGPKAAEMAEGYLQKSGLAPTVVKPKGGNWLSGSVEGSTGPLKGGMVAGQTPAERIPLHEALLQDPTLPPESVETVRRQLDRTRGEDAINNWIDTKLNKYIRNDMGTPEDPVRKLAERGVLHFEPTPIGDVDALQLKRSLKGYPAEGVGQSDLAKSWEDVSDTAIWSKSAGKLTDPTSGLSSFYAEKNPWLTKLPYETPAYGLDSYKASPEELGFTHLIDELRNATRADSDLPANLRWKPEDLKKVTMEQAVERVAKINEYRAAKKAEANEALARNPATAPYKDYQTVPGTQEPNQKGLAWKQIKAPESLPEGWQEAKPNEFGTPRFQRTGSEKIIGRDPRAKALEEALKYEGEVMGHCVGGYCDDVLSGRSQIYSLRDKKGEPHVTIEVEPTNIDPRYWFYNQPDEVTQQIHAQAGPAPSAEEMANLIRQHPQYIKDNEGSLPKIVQIKGKGNAAPKAEYLPFVQDFVRSGNWSRVGDFKNTGMRDMSNTPNLQKWLESKNIPHSRYVTEQEYAKYEADFLADRLNREGFPGFAKGGLVEDTDAIAAKLTGMDKDKALTHALRMANAKQEAHMAAGGLAKLLKGAKKAEEATKAAKATEKVAEAAKPAVIGPQAKALETARKNAVKMLGLPETNTPQDRAKALGFTTDYLHGTQRMDRLLEKKSLDPRRATSGPMPFGTSTPELASGYAMQKVDTSLRAADEGDVTKYFEVAPKDIGLKGMKTPLPVEKAWYFMSPEQRAEIAKLAPRVGYENLDEFTGKFIVHPEGVNATLSPDQWDWIMKREAKGNPLAALREMWHESGQLVNEPEQLGEIYRLAGVKAPISQSNAPWTEAKGVLLGKARITNPLDTANTEQVASVIEPLKQAFARDRSKTSHGPDQWAKQSRYTPKEWVEELERDLAQGKDSYVWTSIPDKVTEELKRLNFNGIIDRSGKGGGAKEPVIIPFEPEQVRSRFAAFDPARINEKDLLGAADPSLLAGTAVASGIGLGALGQMSKPKPEQEEKKKAAGGLAKRM